MEVKDKKVHDNKMLKTMVDKVSNTSSDKSNKMKIIRIKSVSANGSYNANNNFRSLEEKRIRLAIKIRKNSIVSSKNNKLRNTEVMRQSKYLLKLVKKRKYGHRCIAETAFSTIKRTLGEYVSPTRFENMVKEMMIIDQEISV